MDRVLALAEAAGLTVEFRPLRQHSGLLMPNNWVLIDPRKSTMTQRVALAHELGHHHYGHDWRNPHDCQRDEDQANGYAASLLIDVESYAAAEILYESPLAVAAALEVPSRLLEIWCAKQSADITHYQTTV